MIPLEKSVLIQYCDMQAEIKELRRLIKMTEEKIERIEREGAQVAMRMNTLFPKRKIAYTEENCRKRNFRFFEENLKMSHNVPSEHDKV